LGLSQNASPSSPGAFSGNSAPRRAASAAAVHGAAPAAKIPSKYNTLTTERVIKVPHTFVNYSVTRPAVCQHCNKLLTPFLTAKQCKGNDERLVESTENDGPRYIDQITTSRKWTEK